MSIIFNNIIMKLFYIFMISFDIGAETNVHIVYSLHSLPAAAAASGGPLYLIFSIHSLSSLVSKERALWPQLSSLVPLLLL